MSHWLASPPYEIWGALLMSCAEASLETPLLSFSARPWKSKAWVLSWVMGQSKPGGLLWKSWHRAFNWTEEKEGGQMTSIHSCWFCFKELLLFLGGRRGESILRQGNWDFVCFAALEILFCIVSLVQLVFVLGIILMLHNWEKNRSTKYCLKSQIQKKVEPAHFSWKLARC